MPQSVNYGAYFADSFQDFFGPSGSQLQPRLQVRVGQAQKQSLYRGSIGDGFQTMFSLRKRSPAGDRLLDLAAFIDSDGGTPGKDSEARAAATIAALLAFLSSGNTSFGGAFRVHVQRLIEFLERLTGLETDHQELVAAAPACARADNPVDGDWLAVPANTRSQ
jgi:hypothetical protein